jgi:hypothetical protein
MPGSITDAVQRWKNGDQAAQFELEHRLQPFLVEMLELMRRHRAPALQTRIDSEAVVNQALHSFLTGVRQGDFPLLQNRQDACKLLTALVVRALHDEIRWHKRQKRNVDREQASAEGRPEQLPDPRPPDPAVTADLAGWLENLLAAVRPVHEKAMEIVKLSLEGLTNYDIASQVGLGLLRIQVLKQEMYRLLRETHEPKEP